MSGPTDDRERLARELFEAGRGEDPPEGARERALAALGLDGGGGGGRGDGGGAGAGAGASAKAGAGGFGLKLLVAVGIGALVVVGVVVASRPDATPEVAPPSSAATAVVVAAPSASTDSVPRTDPAAAASLDILRPDAAPSASSAPAAVLPRSGPATSSSAPGADSLAGEIGALDRARAKLRAGDAAGALVELDQYDREHPKGAMRSEATIVRIEALARSGQRTAAERLAKPYLDRGPDDLVGRRVRKILDGG